MTFAPAPMLEAVPQTAEQPYKLPLYLFNDGFVFSYGRVSSETIRFTAGLVISLGSGDFELGLGDEMERMQAVAMRPMIQRRLEAELSPIVSFGLTANHPHYRAFSAITGEGYTALPREVFDHLEPQLHLLRSGLATAAQARSITNQFVECALPLLPQPKPIDARVQRALKLLEKNPVYPLDELADAVGLSYDHMSHLFSATMGLPLRSYQLSRKVNAAAQLAYSGLSLTEVAHEAGFSDSSHFSRVWLKAFGATPSFFFGGQYVDVKLEVKGP